MIKKLLSRLSVLVVLIAFASACSNSSEYTNVIPADATAVASFDLQSLVDKSGLDDNENEAAKQKMLNALKTGINAATFQQIEQMMKDPSKSGIDIQSPIYFFTATSFPYMALTAKVSNTDDLRASIEAMVKEQICQPITETDGCSFTSMGSNSLIAFGPTTMLAVQVSGATQTEEAKKSIINLLKQKAENSISKNNGFKKMLKQKGDIRFFASLAAVPETYAKQISMGLPANVNMKDVMMLGSLSFEKGKIVFQYENYAENEEVKAMIKKGEKALKKPDNTFIKNFPASTLVFFNESINGAEYYNLLLENEQMQTLLPFIKKPEVKALISSLDGDLSAGVLNVSMQKNAVSILAYAQVKNADALKKIYDNRKTLGLRRTDQIIQLGKDEYVYKTNSMNVFFGVKEKQMYVTNDETQYKNIGKAVEKSIKDTEYASSMDGKQIFFVLNVDAILELPIVKMLMGLGGEEYKMYYNLVSQISFLEVNVENAQKSQAELVLKNKEVNALKQIVDFVKQFAGM